ncbi:MAG: chloride channel protein [Proteobacteria bacterium]|nr:chloride channel protein [Pseudomonadota bacterium]
MTQQNPSPRPRPHTAVTAMATLALVVISGVGFGVLMAFTTNGFVAGVEFLTSLRQTSNFLRVSLTLGGGEISLSLLPLVAISLAAALILVIRRLFAISRWHGPADSIYAAHHSDNALDVKAGIGSAFAAFVSAGGGASVGQYGPLVHFGASIGSFIRRATHTTLPPGVFIGCGVAGAIAAGFNAPMAGVIFAHEAILRHFSIRAIAAITITSITSAGISKSLFGDPHVFDGIPSLTLVEALPLALIAGPIFGLVAVVYMVAIRTSTQLATASRLSPTQLIAIAALATGLTGMVLPQVLGLGTAEVNAMISDTLVTATTAEAALALLFVILVAKICLTAICLGFGLFGGIFSPAVFVGAATGATLDKVLAMFGIATANPVMIVCGMAAVTGAVIGAPITAVVIMLEMTSNYDYALAAMVSVVLAAIISQALFCHSFYDRQLLDRGIDIAAGRSALAMSAVPVVDFISQEFITAHDNDTPQQVTRRLIKGHASEAYWVGGDGVLKGKLTLHGLLQNPNQSLKSCADTKPLVVAHDANLLDAIEVASGFIGESLPVVDSTNGVMLGVIIERQIFTHYLKTQNRITDLEHNS